LGFLFLGLGAIGVVLPVLPTTPFVLLAALCFSGNSKLGLWLRQSPFFGPYIENYHTKKGISIGHKAASIAFVWAMLAISMMRVHATWLMVFLPLIGAGVTVHLLLIKTKR